MGLRIGDIIPFPVWIGIKIESDVGSRLSLSNGQDRGMQFKKGFVRCYNLCNLHPDGTCVVLSGQSVAESQLEDRDQCVSDLPIGGASGQCAIRLLLGKEGSGAYTMVIPEGA